MITITKHYTIGNNKKQRKSEKERVRGRETRRDRRRNLMKTIRTVDEYIK